MRTLHLSLLTLGLASTLAAQNTQNISFGNRSGSGPATSETNTRRVAFVDVDGDLDLDLFELNYDQQNVVYLNQGGLQAGLPGDFVQDTQLPNQLFDVTLSKGVAFGDIDGDGDADAVIVNGSDRQNFVLLNQGGDQAGREGQYLAVDSGDVASDLHHSYAAALADLDGDGTADLVVANRYQPNMLYFGNGDGSFTRDAGSDVSVGNLGSRDVSVADMDNDGDLDVVFANSTGDLNALHINRDVDEGTFERLTTGDWSVAFGKSYGITTGDLDEDGLPEVIVANRNEANVLFENTSDQEGALQSVALQKVSGSALDDGFADSFCVTVGDLEGDGDADLIFVNSDSPAEMYLASGLAPFDFVNVDAGQPVLLEATSRCLALADVNGDGLPEMALGNIEDQPNFLYDNFGAMWTDEGNGLGGIGGVPQLRGEGQLVPGQVILLGLEGSRPNSLTIFVAGISTLLAPYKGGVLVPTPDIIFAGLATDAFGELNLPVKWPNVIPTGAAFYVQILVADASTPFGTAFSNAVKATSL